MITVRQRSTTNYSSVRDCREEACPSSRLFDDHGTTIYIGTLDSLSDPNDEFDRRVLDRQATHPNGLDPHPAKNAVALRVLMCD